MTKQPNIRRAIMAVRSLDAADAPIIDEIDIQRIHPNPDQPRRTFDEESLRGLAESIERHGLISPILVKAMADPSDGYILAAGERRFRAHQLLKRDTIQAIITTGEVAELSLIENLQREDLNPIEEAEAIARLKDAHHYTDEVLAKTLGKSRSVITETLGITRLPEAIRTECRAPDIPVTKTVLIELVRLGDEAKQLSLWQQVRAGGMTHRDVRAAKSKAKPPRREPNQDMALAAGRRFLKELEVLPAARLALETRERLRELRRALISRFDEIEASAPSDHS
jgi:ParB family transcriptional regulator, chromosome partitioning protein